MSKLPQLNKYQSWNPFAWIFKPAPTQLQIQLHDANQALATILEQITAKELSLIKLRAERKGYEEQINYLRAQQRESGQSYPPITLHSVES